VANPTVPAGAGVARRNVENLLIQSRVVTDPLQNSLIGWWQEYYIFYVKHRDWWIEPTSRR